MNDDRERLERDIVAASGRVNEKDVMFRDIKRLVDRLHERGWRWQYEPDDHCFACGSKETRNTVVEYCGECGEQWYKPGNMPERALSGGREAEAGETK